MVWLGKVWHGQDGLDLSDQSDENDENDHETIVTISASVKKKDPAHGLETVDEASIAPRQGGYAAADNPIIDEP